MDLTKDEIVKMARECNLMDGLVPVRSQLERFASLCRAPLVAEVERLEQWHAEMADNRNAIASERDTLKAELARVREQEPAGYFVPEGWDALGRVTDWAQVVKNQGTPLYATLPQPAAQEPDCATTGVCVRSGLYASPPGAAPVVEQLVEASTMLLSYTLACEGLLNAKPAGQIDIARDAIAAGQKFIKENGK